MNENKEKKPKNIIRGVSKSARFFICDTTELVKEAKEIHNLDPIGAMHFGKLLTAAGMLGCDLKNPRDIVTLKLNGEGPYGKMVAVANAYGQVKGYANDPATKMKQIIDENGNFITDERGRIRFIGEGTFQIIKDLGLREAFSGVSLLEDEDVGEILANYFLMSDQVKSVVSLGVKQDENGNVIKAGGYIIQLLPGAEEDFIDKLEDKIRQIRSITDLLLGGMSLEQIAELIYEDISIIDEEAEGCQKRYIEEYEILARESLEYECNCSKDKFFNGVRSIGQAEIEKILEEDGKIGVECHFCNRNYEFTKNDFRK